MGRRPKFIFFPDYGHVYKIKEDDACSNMVANILPIEPPPRTLGGSNVNSTFSEHVYVAYQIKRRVECSSMKANILPFLKGKYVFL